MNSVVKIKIILSAAAMMMAISTTYVASAETPKNTAETYQLLNLFGDVFERVRAEYVEEPTDEKLIEAAITGMLTALDPHSSFLNSKTLYPIQK